MRSLIAVLAIFLGWVDVSLATTSRKPKAAPVVAAGVAVLQRIEWGPGAAGPVFTVEIHGPAQFSSATAPADPGQGLPARAYVDVRPARLGPADESCDHRGVLSSGQTIGRFEVRAPVGQGGMGAVYVGFDPSLNRQVALKVMHEDLTKDPVAVERFRREALALAKLSHPGVVQVYDLVESEGHLVLVMEHLAGQSLRQRMGAGRMDASEAVNLARELLAALDAAHGVGVLHRDLKPANVFVTSRGEAKLLDFGVARLADATRLTETGELLGTVRYMAPELLRGGEPSARSGATVLSPFLCRV